MLLTKPVRVTKTGNSRTLPIPADAARALRVEVGETFTVEVADDNIIYHRARGAEPTVIGEGARRVAVPRPGSTLPVAGRSTLPALDDWNF